MKLTNKQIETLRCSAERLIDVALDIVLLVSESNEERSQQQGGMTVGDFEPSEVNELFGTKPLAEAMEIMAARRVVG